MPLGCLKRSDFSPQISTCVSFQAIAKANNGHTAGLRYTGTNITVCGRSEMILPLGVGNLQKGERLINFNFWRFKEC